MVLSSSGAQATTRFKRDRVESTGSKKIKTNGVFESCKYCQGHMKPVGDFRDWWKMWAAYSLLNVH